MKKLKLVALVASLLALVMIFAACAPAGTKFSRITDGELYESAPAYSAATKVDKLAEAGLISNEESLFYFQKTDLEDESVTHIVYDIATETVVYEKSFGLTDQVILSFHTVDGAEDDIVFFSVKTELDDEDDTAKTELFTATGTSFASADKILSVSTGADLVLFNEKCYRANKDGVLAEAFAYSALAGDSLPDFITRGKDGYLAIKASGPSPETYVFTAYDENLLPTASFSIPRAADVDTSGGFPFFLLPLPNGDLLAQYEVQEHDEATEYSYIVDGKKVTLLTYVIDISAGKIVAKDSDYKFDEIITTSDEDDFTERYGLDTKNYAAVAAYPVVDGYLLSADADMEILLLSKKGEVKKVVEFAVATDDLPGMITTNRWYLEGLNGDDYLIDEKGKIVGNIDGAEGGNEKYIASEEKLYNFNLEAVFDFAAEELELHDDLYGATVIYFENEDGDVYIYNGELKKLSSDTVHVVEAAYGYYILESEGTYTLYNENGDKLIDNEGTNFQFVGRYEDRLLLAYEVEGKIAYAIVK